MNSTNKMMLYRRAPFFEGYKFREFRDFLKIRENYFCENQNNTVQDGRRHKFAKIKSAK